MAIFQNYILPLFLPPLPLYAKRQRFCLGLKVPPNAQPGNKEKKFLFTFQGHSEHGTQLQHGSTKCKFISFKKNIFMSVPRLQRAFLCKMLTMQFLGWGQTLLPRSRIMPASTKEEWSPILLDSLVPLQDSVSHLNM